MNLAIKKYRSAPKPKPQTFIINVERGVFDLVTPASLFGFTERLKDGRLETTKYAGETEHIPNPRVVLFMNAWPRKSWRKLLSEDRWVVSKLPELTPEDKLKIQKREEFLATIGRERKGLPIF